MSTKTFELLFKNEAGKVKKISISKPKDDIDQSTAKQAIDAIIAADSFVDNLGQKVYIQADGARYVTRTVNDVYTVEA